MRSYTDLLREQYRDGANLDARIALHARFSTAHRDLHDWLMDQIAVDADAAVLEVGCGTGEFWRKTRGRVPPAWSLMLTDFSAGMLTGLRAQAMGWRLNASFARCDAQAIPFPAGSFAVVLANHMLYHVPDLPRALAEIARVLTPSGTLYALTNGEAHMREIGELAIAAGIPQLPMWGLSFRLENGAEWLSPHFAAVERRDFADALAVTEGEPLVAYIASMNASLGLMTPELLGRVWEAVAKRLARDGVIRIQKSTGLFVARRAT